MITKRIVGHLGAYALTLALFAGCQDSSVTPPSDSITPSSVDKAAYTIQQLDEQQLNDFAEVPSFEGVMVDPDFSLNPPGEGRGSKDSARKGDRDTVRKGDRDTTHKGDRDTVRRDPNKEHKWTPRDYLHILKHLQLSDRQWVAIRGCFDDYKHCTASATERYRNARRELFASFRESVARLRHAVENGDITPERAREIYRELVADYRSDAEELAAAYRRALHHCKEELEKCIKDHLTPEQLRRWNEKVG